MYICYLLLYSWQVLSRPELCWCGCVCPWSTLVISSTSWSAWKPVDVNTMYGYNGNRKHKVWLIIIDIETQQNIQETNVLYTAICIKIKCSLILFFFVACSVHLDIQGMFAFESKPGCFLAKRLKLIKRSNLMF